MKDVGVQALLKKEWFPTFNETLKLINVVFDFVMSLDFDKNQLFDSEMKSEPGRIPFLRKTCYESYWGSQVRFIRGFLKCVWVKHLPKHQNYVTENPAIIRVPCDLSSETSPVKQPAGHQRPEGTGDDFLDFTTLLALSFLNISDEVIVPFLSSLSVWYVCGSPCIWPPSLAVTLQRK